MINSQSKLNKDVLDLKKVGQSPTRNGYGEGLVEAGKKNKNVAVLCADLTESTRSEAFAKEFPERFVEASVSPEVVSSRLPVTMKSSFSTMSVCCPMPRSKIALFSNIGVSIRL